MPRPTRAPPDRVRQPDAVFSCGVARACCVALLAVLLAAGCKREPAEADAVRAAAAAFLADQHDADWQAAFARLHPGMRLRCGSAAQLATTVEEAGALPRAWRFDAPLVRRYTAELTGVLTPAGGSDSALLLAFDQEDGHWLVTAWAMGARELCP